MPYCLQNPLLPQSTVRVPTPRKNASKQLRSEGGGPRRNARAVGGVPGLHNQRGKTCQYNAENIRIATERNSKITETDGHINFESATPILFPPIIHKPLAGSGFTTNIAPVSPHRCKAERRLQPHLTKPLLKAQTKSFVPNVLDQSARPSFWTPQKLSSAKCACCTSLQVFDDTVASSSAFCRCNSISSRSF